MKPRLHVRLVLSGIAALSLCGVGVAAKEVATKASVDSVRVVSNTASGAEIKIQIKGGMRYVVDTCSDCVIVSFRGGPDGVSSSLPAQQDMAASDGLVKSVLAAYSKPGQLNSLVFSVSKPPAKAKVARQGDTVTVSLVPAPVAATVAAPAK